MITLTGDLESASQYLAYAKAKLVQCKQYAKSMGLKVYYMPQIITNEALISVGVCNGLDLITIKGFGVAPIFYIAGKAHAASSVSFGDPTLTWRVEEVNENTGELSHIDFGTSAEVMPDVFTVSSIQYLSGVVYITYPKFTGFYPAIAWRVVQRKTDDSVVWDQTLPGFFYGVPSNIVEDKNNIYVCGIVVAMLPGYGGYVTGNILGRVEARDKKTGAIVWEYNQPDTFTTFRNCIAIDKTTVYVGGYYPTMDGGYTWTVETYDLITGAPGWYKEFHDYLGGRPSAISVDDNYVYIAGQQYSDVGISAPYLRVEQRDKQSGNIIQTYIAPTFHLGAYVSSDLSSAGLMQQFKDSFFMNISYPGLGTFGLAKMDKATMLPLWTIGFSTFESCVTTDQTGNPLMYCNTLDGHYFFQKRKSSDGSLIWETKPSVLYGL